MNKLVHALPAILAVLCLLAFLPWTLGVPGVDNDYAKGWTIGFNAIVWYLVFYAATMALSLIARLARRPIPRWLNWLRMGGLAAFVVAQAFAWPLILR